jgi:hypothetical protein
MAFGQTAKLVQQTKEESPKRESPYLNMSPGEKYVRILGEEVTFWRYWIPVNIGGKMQGRPIIAQKDNPIRDNQRLSEDLKKPSRRFLVNVLDLTPVVFHNDVVLYPDENAEYRIDDVVVTEKPTPRNKVALLEFGNSLMNDILAFDGRIRSRLDHSVVLRVDQIDLCLVVTGSGKNRNIRVVPGYNEGPVDVDEIYDLQSLVTPYPNEAIEELLAGEDYNEVLNKYKLTRNYVKIPFRQNK